MSAKGDKRRERQAAHAERQVNPKPAWKPSKVKRVRRSRVASREEQYGRYIDCGPAAWDDR